MELPNTFQKEQSDDNLDQVDKIENTYKNSTVDSEWSGRKKYHRESKK